MSPALNRSSAIRCFKGSDVIEIHDRITFDFYTGLPHVLHIIVGKRPWCIEETFMQTLTQTPGL